MYTIMIRTIITFFIVIIVMRTMGKRQIGDLHPFELVVTIIVSEIAGHPIVDPKTPLSYGLVPLITLLFLEVLVSFVELKSNKLRLLLSGYPSIIISNGKLDIKEMGKQRVNTDDLLEELRVLGYFDIADIQYAILETSGRVSVIPKSDKEVLKREDMKIKKTESHMPLIIIMDGEIRKHNLSIIEKDKKWLHDQLSSQKVYDIKNVFLAMLDSKGKLVIQLKHMTGDKNSKTKVFKMEDKKP